MKSILDPSFKYIPSAQTDLRKTFARVRREMAQGKQESPPPEDSKVVTLRKVRKGNT